MRSKSFVVLNNLYTIFHLVFTKQVDLYDLPVCILYRHLLLKIKQQSL